MSCCGCILFDEACLKKAASIPLTTNWETIDDSYKMVLYQLEEKIGRECVEALCADKELYAEAISELLPYFGLELSYKYKTRKIDANNVLGSSKIPNNDNGNTTAALQQTSYESEVLWRRFMNWLNKNRDSFPACYTSEQECNTVPYYTPFYTGRNYRVR